MPCLIRSPWAPWHRSRRPVQWPAAARMESGQCQDEEPCSSIQSEYSHTTNTRRGTITLIRSGVSTIMVIDAESWNPFYRYPQNFHISLTLDPVYLWYPDTEGQREAGISADGIIGITSTGQCWHDPVWEHSPSRLRTLNIGLRVLILHTFHAGIQTTNNWKSERSGKWAR